MVKVTGQEAARSGRIIPLFGGAEHRSSTKSSLSAQDSFVPLKCSDRSKENKCSLVRLAAIL